MKYRNKLKLKLLNDMPLFFVLDNKTNQILYISSRKIDCVHFINTDTSKIQLCRILESDFLESYLCTSLGGIESICV